jgi:hypothetical protein
VLGQVEASGGRVAGFYVGGGDVTLTGCVAHDNGAEGLQLRTEAKLTARALDTCGASFIHLLSICMNDAGVGER